MELKLVGAGSDIYRSCYQFVGFVYCANYRPAALVGLRKLGRTYRAPAIPYVTRWDHDDDRIERLQAALFNAFADSHITTTRQALYLKNIEVLPVSAYRRSPRTH